MYEIYLKGEINSEVKEGFINDSLLEIELDKANGQDLEIKINSIGGCVDTAFKMFDLLEKYKKYKKAVVTTITDEVCASSGVILLLAGNRRIVNNNTEPFIHQAFIQFDKDTTANANDLFNASWDLEDVNCRIASLYAQKTSLDYDLARELMNLETLFTPEEALEIGFATEISKVYNKLNKSAKFIIQNKLEHKTNINMTKEEKSLLELIRNFFNPKDEKKSEIKNKIELTVSDVEVDFVDLDSDATPVIGDKANVDGKPAEGDYIMKNGNKYSFEGGALTEIEKEEEVKVDEVQNQLNEANLTIETQNKKIEELTTTINKLTEENKSNLSTIKKFNKLQSEFEKFEKKNQSKTEQAKEVEKSLDLSDLNSNLKKMTKK